MNKKNNYSVDIGEVCRRAIEEGRLIDLEGIEYAEPFYPQRPKSVCDYYCFLSGLVRSQRFTRIVEIGTGYGGSIKAIAEGLHPESRSSARVATIDIEETNKDSFANYPHIKRIISDALNEDVIHEVSEYCGGSIDLLFVDAKHTYAQVKRYIAAYGNRLRPKYIVIDDIKFTFFMKVLWGEIKLEFKKNALDITELIYRGKSGMGIVYWGQRFRRYWQFSGYLSVIFDLLNDMIIRMKNMLKK